MWWFDRTRERLQDISAAPPAPASTCTHCGSEFRDAMRFCSNCWNDTAIAKTVAEAKLKAPASERELRELVAKWMKIFHEMSSTHFGGEGERIGNIYRLCADELERVLAHEGQGGQYGSLSVANSGYLDSGSVVGSGNNQSSGPEQGGQKEALQPTARLTVVPSLWRIERCTKHEDYDPACAACAEEILTSKTEAAYRAGFNAALAAQPKEEPK